MVYGTGKQRRFSLVGEEARVREKNTLYLLW